jgi:uncharacterized repeat protein (TIGR03803 family)
MGIKGEYRLATRGRESQSFALRQPVNNPDGNSPQAGLLRDANGNLYGTTIQGGTFNAGTVFRVSPSGQQYEVLTSFAGSGAAYPTSALVWGRSGNLYGTTEEGGDFGKGTVFEANAANAVTVLHSFGASGDGAYPVAGLVRDASGNFYGTTQGGGVTISLCDPLGCGTVFRLDPEGNETVLYNFTDKRDGSQPVAAILLDSSGNLYTTAESGGIKTCTESIYGCGTALEISQTGKVRVLHDFAGGPADGRSPMAPLLRVGKILYGTTYDGGPFGDCGTIFKQTLPGASAGD